MKLIDNQLGGTTPMDIIIKFPDSQSDDYDDDNSKSKTNKNNSVHNEK
jgi:hypothetical protein